MARVARVAGGQGPAGDTEVAREFHNREEAIAAGIDYDGIQAFADHLAATINESDLHARDKLIALVNVLGSAIARSARASGIEVGDLSDDICEKLRCIAAVRGMEPDA